MSAPATTCTNVCEGSTAANCLHVRIGVETHFIVAILQEFFLQVQ